MTNLIVANIIIGLVNAPTIRARTKSLSNVLNVRKTIDQDIRRPALVAFGYRIEIYWYSVS